MSDPGIDTNTVALSHLAAGTCTTIGHCLLLCRPAHVKNVESVDSSTHCTWKIKGSVLVTILKDESSRSLVYLHETDRLYHLNPASGIILAVTMPPCTAVLAQYYLDDVHESSDGMPPSYRHEMRLIDAIVVAGESMRGVSPEDRYATLNEGIASGWFDGTVQSQWAGLYSAITPIFEGRVPLPHTPLCPLCPSTKDPLELLTPPVPHSPVSGGADQ
jgi:hypothetical protein